MRLPENAGQWIYAVVAEPMIATNTVAEAHTYTDESGTEQHGSKQVTEYADVTYVEQVTRPESKSKGDLERVIRLGKPQAVLDSFGCMVSVGEQWGFFDSYLIYLDELAEITAYNDDLPVSHQDENDEGNIVVINTCGFIGKAKEESVNTILHYDFREKHYSYLQSS